MTQRMLSRIWPHVPPAQRRRLIAQLSQMVTRRLDMTAPAEETPNEHDSALTPFAHHKIHGSHYDRLAAVYVRQSTPQQMLRHQESTRLQYGLVERALALGWAQPQVWVMDED